MLPSLKESHPVRQHFEIFASAVSKLCGTPITLSEVKFDSLTSKVERRFAIMTSSWLISLLADYERCNWIRSRWNSVTEVGRVHHKGSGWGVFSLVITSSWLIASFVQVSSSLLRSLIIYLRRSSYFSRNRKRQKPNEVRYTYHIRHFYSFW